MTALRRAALLALPLLVAGCGDSPSEPRSAEVDLVVVSRHVIVTGGESGLRLLEQTGGELLFDAAPSARIPEPGDILAGGESGGFLERVIGIDRAGEALLVETEPAALVDAVRSGSLTITLPVGFGAPGAGVDLSGLVLIESAGGAVPANVVVEEGFFSFAGRLDLSLAVAGGRLDELEATVTGILGFDCRCSVEADGADAHGRAPVVEIVIPFAGLIGPLPVAGEAVLTFSISWALDGLTTEGCSAGVRALAGVPATATVSFRGGAWTGSGDRFYAGDEAVLACDGTTGGALAVGAVLDVAVRLYDRPAVAIVLAPGFDLRTRTETPPVWFWELRSTFASDAVADPSVLDRGRPHFAGPLSRESRILDAGPFATEEYALVGGWGGLGTGEGLFDTPRGIALGENRVYVSDTWNHRVQVFSPAGGFLGAWGARGSSPGLFEYPGKLAVDPSGRVLVVDTQNRRVQIFDANGLFLGVFGAAGTGDGEFLEPSGIAVDEAGTVYVADAASHRVQTFAPDGSFRSSWGRLGDGPGEFDTPLDIAVRGGRVYVAECRNHRVQAFTTEGTFLFAWGGEGVDPGFFDCPAGIAVDAAGYVLVVDYGNGRLQRFTADGLLDAVLGAEGTGEGQFERPEGVAVGALLFLLDTGNDRVRVFAPR
ncbi:MAG: hypothetical protein JW876_02455 [Candidatus Krumholzibacteriota bacterium]|nr:hypothetical protein [Candidatus Krumholzibacteriota bacterium]